MADMDYKYIGELVSRAVSGDSDAFAELYAATYQRQYLYACCYMKDEFLAQDALQETYITALKNLGSLRDPKLFISWLNQINFRVCYAMAARQARYNAEMESFADTADTRPDTGQTPEERAVQVDTDEYLMQQVMALPCTESQVILMHYFNNLKIEDIAYIMEISKSTVKRYLASGKARLAKAVSL